MRGRKDGGKKGKSVDKILVVDDEPKLVDMIVEYLRAEGFWAVGLTDGVQALQAAHSERPDLIVLDVLMPGRNGFDILRELRKTADIPVILLTAKAEEADKVLGLELGADDYLTKPFSLRELVARIRVVLRRLQKGASASGRLSAVPLSAATSTGSTDASPGEEVLRAGPLVVFPERMEVYKNGKKIALTPTEFKLLEAFVRHPKKVFTRMQLLEILGDAYIGYDRVLDTHVSNLRKKIEDVPSQPKLILTVYGVGYKFGGDG
ncbi:MAG: response regulator transcription factor [Hydrogenibacillus schlegelii]|uniref:Response regulator transcription factor n=1 Tax=Hydrogenibacillus schlegelii TaxID=1484 RepID=A0A947GCV2_HYDSH|nr:response regulator transcription factor [Hydrogenibacillus schlegelii]